ncbi:MAG: hypothetical protein A3D44_03780 [Candidatus Staskawiczbacteria bacterium RIFCSPHIGHO2_02_FULL_42_22]|uniref:Maf-like protein n=1 Tax=Candidatus Staskawiczbacteria bacterium RIFCSPHIGHO2_02_FULL_42_22 TaxID=1802207 RepID=A0A1G2I4B3_9BACT|nr:MAG: hypothetical protein A3D44_03780 [Candidatus Staskawiczbacteria bacterium RIFCSPHIGHO2_02_FULL_42_22]
MAFAKEMLDTKNQLEKLGHICFIPESTDNYAEGKMEKVSGSESAERKIANNFIRKHYELITNSDAILVLNYDKKGVKNYIGGNSLMEMGFAHVHNKKVFLLNPVPYLSYSDEISAMTNMVLNGDLNKIA